MSYTGNFKWEHSARPTFKNWAPIIFANISISLFSQEVETNLGDDFQTDLLEGK